MCQFVPTARKRGTGRGRGGGVDIAVMAVETGVATKITHAYNNAKRHRVERCFAGSQAAALRSDDGSKGRHERCGVMYGPQDGVGAYRKHHTPVEVSSVSHLFFHDLIWSLWSSGSQREQQQDRCQQLHKYQHHKKSIVSVKGQRHGVPAGKEGSA